MNAQKVSEVFGRYETHLQQMGVVPRQLAEEEYLVLPEALTESQILGHLLYMCTAGAEHAQNGGLDKAFRWLGFVQGTLWSRGIYPINDLKEHSRPLP